MCSRDHSLDSTWSKLDHRPTSIPSLRDNKFNTTLKEDKCDNSRIPLPKEDSQWQDQAHQSPTTSHQWVLLKDRHQTRVHLHRDKTCQINKIRCDQDHNQLFNSLTFHHLSSNHHSMDSNSQTLVHHLRMTSTILIQDRVVSSTRAWIQTSDMVSQPSTIDRLLQFRVSHNRTRESHSNQSHRLLQPKQAQSARSQVQFKTILQVQDSNKTDPVHQSLHRWLAQLFQPRIKCKLLCHPVQAPKKHSTPPKSNSSNPHKALQA